MISSLGFMFTFASYSVAICSVGSLLNWYVSKVTSLKGMFKNYGSGADTIVLNLSGWNISSVTDMTDMFNNFAVKCLDITITIPKTSGSLTNTTDKFYGSSSSVYAELANRRTFTLAT